MLCLLMSKRNFSVSNLLLNLGSPVQKPIIYSLCPKKQLKSPLSIVSQSEVLGFGCIKSRKCGL